MFKVMGLITLDIFTKVNHSKQTHFPWADNIIMEKSNMHLFIQSDASYLSRFGARSVAGGLLYCGNIGDRVTVNGAILAVSIIIPTVC